MVLLYARTARPGNVSSRAAEALPHPGQHCLQNKQMPRIEFGRRALVISK
jgi:hypothetical protein